MIPSSGASLSDMELTAKRSHPIEEDLHPVIPALECLSEIIALFLSIYNVKVM